MFFHALTFMEDAVWIGGRQVEYSNIIWGTQQVLMQWNKHEWSLFLHILPNFNLNGTENVTKISLFLHWISLNKMASALNFPSLRCHNSIDPLIMFSCTKASTKWSVKAAMFNYAIQIRAHLGFYKLKPMFKQHMNLMIWTWIFAASNSFS